MPRTRKTHHARLKAKGTVEAIRGVRAATETATAFHVRLNLVANGKRQALEQLLARVQAPKKAPSTSGTMG